VNFTDAMIEKLSPIRHLDRLNAPLVVSYGTYETPEFIRQAKEFAAAVQAVGKPVEMIVCETSRDVRDVLHALWPARRRNAEDDGVECRLSTTSFQIPLARLDPAIHVFKLADRRDHPNPGCRGGSVAPGQARPRGLRGCRSRCGRRIAAARFLLC
jgi:hypothetical protein